MSLRKNKFLTQIGRPVLWRWWRRNLFSPGQRLPPIPDELSMKQRKEICELLNELKDVFAGKDFKLGNTDLINTKFISRNHPFGNLIEGKIRKSGNMSRNN